MSALLCKAKLSVQRGLCFPKTELSGPNYGRLTHLAAHLLEISSDAPQANFSLPVTSAPRGLRREAGMLLGRVQWAGNWIRYIGNNLSGTSIRFNIPVWDVWQDENSWQAEPSLPPTTASQPEHSYPESTPPSSFLLCVRLEFLGARCCTRILFIMDFV